VLKDKVTNVSGSASGMGRPTARKCATLHLQAPTIEVSGGGLLAYTPGATCSPSLRARGTR